MIMRGAFYRSCRALPHLNNKRIQEKAEKTLEGDLGISNILKWLWDVVAYLVLNALGFTQTPSDNKWLHS